MAIQKGVTCPECEHEFEVTVEMSRNRQTDEFGYTEGTKGSFIALQIKEAGEHGITVDDLKKRCKEKFGDPSEARIRRVVHELSQTTNITILKASPRVANLNPLEVTEEEEETSPTMPTTPEEVDEKTKEVVENLVPEEPEEVVESATYADVMAEEEKKRKRSEAAKKSAETRRKNREAAEKAKA